MRGREGGLATAGARMDLTLLFGFSLAVLLLMLMPGPTVAFILGSSVQHGTRAGLVAVAGTLAAIFVQLASIGFGMWALLSYVRAAIDWLRWIAVLYLAWLAYCAWRASHGEAAASCPTPNMRAVLGRAFLISISNPKYLFFYTAVLPQFVSARHQLEPQLIIFSTAFLLIAFVIDICWAMAGGKLRSIPEQTRNRMTAVLFVLAAAGLAGTV